MKVADIFQLSTRIFKTNKMRTILTVLGIGVGIGAILFLVSLGYGLQKIILERIASSDALLALDITPGSTEELGLNQDLIDKLSKNEMVSEVSPLVSNNALINIKSFSGGAEIEFVKNSFSRLSGMELESGEFFKDEETDKIVVTTAILKLFNMDAESFENINDTVKITLVVPKKADENSLENIEGEVELRELVQEFTISGVLRDDNSPYVFINIANLDKNIVKEYNQLKIKALDKKSVEPLRDEIFAMGYGVSSISETIDQANKIFTIIQIVLGAFGVIALTVSAIGMFNTMTISLLQRTKEIGIMKAIGAKNRDIKKLFLTEAVIIGFLGGASGLGIGYALEAIFNLLLNLLAKTLGGASLSLFYTPLWFIVLIIAFSTIVGFLTGVYPAIRASRLNALDALRYK